MEKTKCILKPWTILKDRTTHSSCLQPEKTKGERIRDLKKKQKKRRAEQLVGEKKILWMKSSYTTLNYYDQQYADLGAATGRRWNETWRWRRRRKKTHRSRSRELERRKGEARCYSNVPKEWTYLHSFTDPVVVASGIKAHSSEPWRRRHLCCLVFFRRDPRKITRISSTREWEFLTEPFPYAVGRVSTTIILFPTSSTNAVAKAAAPVTSANNLTLQCPTPLTQRSSSRSQQQRDLSQRSQLQNIQKNTRILTENRD